MCNEGKWLNLSCNEEWWCSIYSNEALILKMENDQKYKQREEKNLL
jgi:hypothetical protein